MRFAIAAAAVIGAASASYGYSNVTTTTEVVTAYTTYCPGATEIPVGPSSTITVTEATTLTITNCPCTLTHTYPVVPVSSAPAPVYTPPVYSSAPAPAPYPSKNATVPTYGQPSGSPVKTAAPTQFTGAASTLQLPAVLLAGAGLAALF